MTFGLIAGARRYGHDTVEAFKIKKVLNAARERLRLDHVLVGPLTADDTHHFDAIVADWALTSGAKWSHYAFDKPTELLQFNPDFILAFQGADPELLETAKTRGVKVHEIGKQP